MNDSDEDVANEVTAGTTYKANIDPWFLENHDFRIKKPMMPVAKNGKNQKKGQTDFKSVSDFSKTNKVKFNFANSQNILNGQNEKSKINRNGGISFNKYAASKPVKPKIIPGKIRGKNGPAAIALTQIMPEQTKPQKISKKRKAW